jgi:hypothetical protein
MSFSSLIGKSVGMKTGAPFNVGKGFELTNLSLHFSHFQLPLTSSLCLFKALLLSLKVFDAELGVIDVMLAFLISGDLGLNGPIAFLTYLGREDRIRSGQTGKEVGEPGRKGEDGVSLLIVIIVDVGDGIKLTNVGLLTLSILLGEPHNQSIGDLADPVDRLELVVANWDEKVGGASMNIT